MRISVPTLALALATSVSSADLHAQVGIDFEGLTIPTPPGYVLVTNQYAPAPQSALFTSTGGAVAVQYFTGMFGGPPGSHRAVGTNTVGGATVPDATQRITITFQDQGFPSIPAPTASVQIALHTSGGATATVNAFDAGGALVASATGGGGASVVVSTATPQITTVRVLPPSGGTVAIDDLVYDVPMSTCNTSYGTGCAGAGTVVPTLATLSWCTPSVGTITLTLDQAPPGATANFVYGLNSGATGIGGGCLLLVAPPATTVVVTVPPPGNVTVFVPVSLPPGTSVFTQVILPDPANPTLPRATNGIQLDLQ